MPAGVNSTSNIGVRRMIYSLATPEYRNFEVNGTQTYNVTVNARVPFVYGNVVVPPGATIPYDDAGTRYTNPGFLEVCFNMGWIDPSN
jgi:hypothetical protein